MLNNRRECYILTRALRTKSFIWLWLKSHVDRSTSTSPRKLFLPKVSLCQTERSRVRVLSSSRRTRYCRRKENSSTFTLVLKKKQEQHTLFCSTDSQNLVEFWIQRFLLHRRFPFSQICFVWKQVTFHIPEEREHEKGSFFTKYFVITH